MLRPVSQLSVMFGLSLTFGRTELGHGSNVRGIECQARWMPKTKEFVIHSPTLTASKWVS